VQGYRHYLNMVTPYFKSKIHTWGIGSSFDHHVQQQQQQQYVGSRPGIEYSPPEIIDFDATMGGLPEAMDLGFGTKPVAFAVGDDHLAAATSYGRASLLDASASRRNQGARGALGDRGAGAEHQGVTFPHALAGPAELEIQGSVANLHVSPSESQPRQPSQHEHGYFNRQQQQQQQQQQLFIPDQTFEKISSGTKHLLDDKNLSEQQKLVLSLIEEIDVSRGISGVREDCKICGASFSRKYELKRHLKSTHLELRDFECPLCSSKFKRKQHLDTHHQQVHEKNKGVVFHCHLCDKKFTADSSRRRHLRSVHSVEAPGDAAAGPSKETDDAME